MEYLAILFYTFIKEKKFFLGLVFINKTIIISDIEEKGEEEGYNYSKKGRIDSLIAARGA